MSGRLKKGFREKYSVFKHHAWAGSVLLAVLLATRVFLEKLGVKNYDTLFVAIGSILVLYTLSAVILTYRYRSGLYVDSNMGNLHVHYPSDNPDVKREKQFLKTEKKKLKAEVKKIKKTRKKL